MPAVEEAVRSGADSTPSSREAVPYARPARTAKAKAPTASTGRMAGGRATRSLELDHLPFAKLMGINVVSVAPDLVVGELKVREDLCTRPAVLHGGATAGSKGPVPWLPGGGPVGFFLAAPPPLPVPSL